MTQRFLSGADCGWTSIEASEDLYRRRNGRTFRIVRAKDKRWKLFRVVMVGDSGILLGTYLGRGDANKALLQIAYQPDTSG